MRHYEIHRTLIQIKHERFNKAIRYKAFNNGTNKFITEERKQEMFQEQMKFILALRAEMKPNGVYPDLTEYKDKKMSIIPIESDDSMYMLIFFDKDIDDKKTIIKYDKEQDLLYIED